MIYWQLFWSFAQVGFFCVGGGYASMPLIQAQVIDLHGWLTMREFIDIFTISQMTPGPIGINAATFVGAKVAGVPGAIAATFGFVAPSVIIVLLLARLFFRYGDIGPVRGVLNGLRPAVIALICAAGVGFVLLALWNKEAPPVSWAEFDFGGCFMLLAAFIALRVRKCGVIQVLLLSGALGLIVGCVRG